MTLKNRRWITIKKWLRILNLSRALRWAIYLLLLNWIYQNWHQDLPVEALNQRYLLPDSRFVEVDGMPVHYRVSGQGESILLLHDANSSLQTWAMWTAQLSPKYQVISVDLPGFGLTGPHPRGSYSAFMYANFLEQLVKQLNLTTFDLVGNGLGAQVAWFYAAEYPTRLRKLVLLDAPGFEPKSSGAISLLARTPVLNRAIWNITPKAFIRLMLQDIYADDGLVTDSLVQRHFELLLRPGNRKAFTDRAAVSDNRPPVDIIEKITAPTLILWGAEDTRISPEYAYEFHRRIHGAFLRIYQNTGHWPQEENPVQTAQDVQAFLEGKF
ncbi:MAG: alpha/beta hydrolase [Saprospiraceae bacterium]